MNGSRTVRFDHVGHAVRLQLNEESNQKPYDIFRALDLGDGGYSVAPSTQSKHAVRRAIRKKLDR